MPMYFAASDRRRCKSPILSKVSLELRATRFEEAASNFKIRSLEVLDKGLLLIKVFHSVEPVGGKKTAKGHIEYPVRSGRITIWKSVKSTEG
jgi:hypothetical protein